jgi:hypothetical protein
MMRTEWRKLFGEQQRKDMTGQVRRFTEDEDICYVQLHIAILAAQEGMKEAVPVMD